MGGLSRIKQLTVVGLDLVGDERANRMGIPTDGGKCRVAVVILELAHRGLADPHDVTHGLLAQLTCPADLNQAAKQLAIVVGEHLRTEKGRRVRIKAEGLFQRRHSLKLI